MCRRAFTLIELLVVIAIIALLVSILLPSLSRAKSLAQATVSLSNIRSIGSWAAMKSQDNGGYVVYNGMTVPARNAWETTYDYYYTGYEEDTVWWLQIAEDMGFEVAFPGNTLLKDPQYKGVRSEASSLESVREGCQVDYGLNACMGGWKMKTGATPRPLTALNSEVYLFAPGSKRDSDGFTAEYSETEGSTYFGFPWAWKLSTAVTVQAPFLYGDYHAEFLPWEKRDAMTSAEFDQFYRNR